MKKLFKISLFIFSALVLFAISGCANTILSTPTSTPTQIQSATLPPTLTATPSPTLTPTPVPVTIQEAIQRGTFAELEVFNKGQIDYSPLSYIGKIIRLSTFSPDGLQFVAVTKRGIYAYDVESWQELFFVPLSIEVSITSINYSADGSLFAVGDSIGTITFWNTKTWEVQNSFQVHKGAVTSLDISPDNMNFVTIGEQKEISIWNMSDGSLIKSQFRSKDSGPAYYSLDGKWLYISEEPNNLIIWSSEELTLTNRLGQLGQRPPEQALSPYTNTVAAFGFRIITLYDFDKKETIRLDLEAELGVSFFDRLTNMIFLDEKTLMVKFEDFEDYSLIDLENHTITSISLKVLSEKTFKNHELLNLIKSEEIKALGFEALGNIKNITPDGTALILSRRNEIPSGVFDLNQTKMKDVIIQEFPWESSIFLSDGFLAGVDWSHPIRNPPFANKAQQGDFTITILDSSFFVKSTIKQAYDFPDYIDIATVSPSGKILAAGTADGNLYLWNLEDKKLITTIRAHNKVVGMFGFYGAYSGLFFDEDGSHLATWGQDGKIKVLNIVDLSEVVAVNGNAPVFSSDGNHLAYISSDDSIRLISLLDDETPKIFRGKKNPRQIAFSPDGNLMFTGHWDNNIGILQVWSIADGISLLDVPQYSSISSLIVSPDGTRLYIQDGYGVISVWGHKPE